MNKFSCAQCNGPINILCRIKIPSLKINNEDYTEFFTTQCIVCNHIMNFERTGKFCPQKLKEKEE